MRLDAGEREFGDQWTTRSPRELVGEMLEEAADIGGWGVLVLQLLDPNAAGDMCEREQSAALLLRALALAAEAHALLAAALDEVLEA